MCKFYIACFMGIASGIQCCSMWITCKQSFSGIGFKIFFLPITIVTCVYTTLTPVICMLVCFKTRHKIRDRFTINSCNCLWAVRKSFRNAFTHDWNNFNFCAVSIAVVLYPLCGHTISVTLIIANARESMHFVAIIVYDLPCTCKRAWCGSLTC